MDEEFPVGEHKFPFAFQIPKDIPSSFETHIGRVRYQVKAVADRPWHFDDSSKAIFSVNHLLDLSSDSIARVRFSFFVFEGELRENIKVPHNNWFDLPKQIM